MSSDSAAASDLPQVRAEQQLNEKQNKQQSWCGVVRGGAGRGGAQLAEGCVFATPEGAGRLSGAAPLSAAGAECRQGALGQLSETMLGTLRARDTRGWHF